MRKGNGGTSKAVYTIRILVGIYLIYIDYQIFDDVMGRQGMSRIVMMAIMALFLVVGLAFIIFSLKGLTTVGSGNDSGAEENGSEGSGTEDSGAMENSVAENSAEDSGTEDGKDGNE